MMVIFVHAFSFFFLALRARADDGSSGSSGNYYDADGNGMDMYGQNLNYNANQLYNADDDTYAAGGDDAYVHNNVNTMQYYTNDDAYANDQGSSGSSGNGNSNYNSNSNSYYNYNSNSNSYYNYNSNSNSNYNSAQQNNLRQWLSSKFSKQQGSEAAEATVQNCDDATIRVNSVKIMCDSPFAYFYGNGGHRSSPVCDYGDMATVMVDFDTISSLRSVDTVYMTMGVYATKVETELLFDAMNVNVKDLVGKGVNRKGNYQFSMRIVLDKVGGDNSQFVPTFEFGFSSMQDEGYNLGGVNINCQYNGQNQPYSSLLQKAKLNSAERYGAGPTMHYASIGMLLGMALLGATFYYFYDKRKTEEEGLNGGGKVYDEETAKTSAYVDAQDMDDDNSLFK